jgi:hypothetical protein
MPEAAKVIGGRQSTRPPADHENPFACGRLNRDGPALLARQITEVAFNGVNADRAVELRPVTARFARVIANPPVNGGERVVLDEL